MNLSAILTDRQLQITHGLVIGMVHKEIAAELNRSPRTIENTIVNALKKIDGKKSADLIVWWFVTHFSIPIESLPKSITAMIFLLLFFTATNNERAARSSRTRRNEIEYLIEA